MGDISLSLWYERMARRKKEIDDRKDLSNKFFLDRDVYKVINGNKKRFFYSGKEYKLEKREESKNRKLTRWL